MTAQLARHFGLTVLATTRNPAKVERLRQAGADHVLLNDGSLAPQVHKLFPQGVNWVLDIVGNAWTLHTFEPVVAITSTVRHTFYSGDVADFLATPLAWFADEVAAGRRAVLLGRTFNFREFVEAHRYIAGNEATGKAVVLVGK